MNAKGFLDHPSAGLGKLNDLGQEAPELSFPERLCRPETLLSLILFVLSFLYLCLFRRYTSMEPDEGIVLQGAQRILEGQVLYRDFFSFYTPASYYFLALFFRFFGSSLATARIALALAGALFSLMTYLLARRVCNRPIALLMAALTTFTALPYRFLVLHNWDSTLWACLCVYATVRMIEKQEPGKNWKWAAAAGAFAAITTLSEQSKGAGLILGLALAFLLLKLCLGASVLPHRADSLAILCGFFVPVVITLAYFASRNAIRPMLGDWLWPLRNYSAANHVPYGYQNWSDSARHMIFGSGSLPERMVKIIAVSPCFWIPALPPLALLGLAYRLAKIRSSKVAEDKISYYIVVTSAYLGLALSVVVTRPDIIHFMYLQPLNCLILAWLLDGCQLQSHFFNSLRPMLVAYVGISLVLFGLVPLTVVAAPSKLLQTRRGIVATREPDTVVEYFLERVPEGKKVLVYPYLPLYYYLTGTMSPGPYDYFQPGMHTPEQANELLLELTSHHVDEVLFEPNFPDKFAHSWPGTPLAAIAKDPVADYIARNYHSCTVLTSSGGWHFLFMVRKDISCY